jgi:predicted negative regulator of RcsB-dependent stress response
VARITRKELKTDKFALEVEHTVDFFEAHRQEIIRYGAIALAAILLILGYAVYSRHRHTEREQALTQAITTQEAAIAPYSTNGGLTFPSQEAKDQAATKAFTEIRTKYSGTAEAGVAGYYLGSILADQGKMADAEKTLDEVAQKGDARYASLAKLSLVQIYFAEGQDDRGEKLLRDMIAHPTVFVSKDQATISLAGYLMPKQPEEARTLLTPLLNRNDAVGQVALTLAGQLPRK